MRTDGPVLVALAHSARSEHTLAWATAEAVRRGTELRLVAVVDPVTEVTAWSWAVVPPAVDVHAEARSYLADLADRVRARPDAPPGVKFEVLDGSPADALRRVSERASLVVVGAGSRGGGHVARVAAQVAAHARCPVAVVRDAPTSTADGAPAPVVVGVDGSAAAIAAAHVAAAAAAERGARLRLVHARPTIPAPYGPVPVELPPADDAPARRAADELVARLRAHHPDLEVDVRLVEDDPAHAIVAACGDAQLVVVGSRGLGAFPGMLLGSVSHDVVRDAPCTVLVVHGAEVPAA
ncbi:universal stress protein [Cellulomonas iranensis]|uniref:universal stress protein n=1 Tax=Cellulomonas iranensis TaxID=76862 RepID=UPI00117866CF|nr:universal stress protein [Cellulomonas iranensis]